MKIDDKYNLLDFILITLILTTSTMALNRSSIDELAKFKRNGDNCQHRWKTENGKSDAYLKENMTHIKRFGHNHHHS